MTRLLPFILAFVLFTIPTVSHLAVADSGKVLSDQDRDHEVNKE